MRNLVINHTSHVCGPPWSDVETNRDFFFETFLMCISDSDSSEAHIFFALFNGRFRTEDSNGRYIDKFTHVLIIGHLRSQQNWDSILKLGHCYLFSRVPSSKASCPGRSGFCKSLMPVLRLDERCNYPAKVRVINEIVPMSPQYSSKTVELENGIESVRFSTRFSSRFEAEIILMNYQAADINFSIYSERNEALNDRCNKETGGLSLLGWDKEWIISLFNLVARLSRWPLVAPILIEVDPSAAPASFCIFLQLSRIESVVPSRPCAPNSRYVSMHPHHPPLSHFTREKMGWRFGRRDFFWRGFH